VGTESFNRWKENGKTKNPKRLTRKAPSFIFQKNSGERARGNGWAVGLKTQNAGFSEKMKAWKSQIDRATTSQWEQFGGAQSLVKKKKRSGLDASE